jgi:hypothetical protein
MANYRESNISGTAWTRARRVIINHPVEGGSTIHFQEEQAIQTPAGVTTIPADVVVDTFDPARDIALLDPTTGQPTGQTLSEAVVYLALYSKYMALAQARDVATEPAPAPAPAPEPEPEPEPPAEGA